jgi:transposase
MQGERRFLARYSPDVAPTESAFATLKQAG